jgi:PEP-CTERM motif
LQDKNPMQKRTLCHLFPVAALCAGLAPAAQAGLTNGSFESLSVAMPGGANGNYVITDAANVPGWKTTAADNRIEVWQSPGPAFFPVSADDGNRFAELNANLVSTLYQDVTGIGTGQIVGWKLSHRGRTGPDAMKLTLTDLGVDGMFGTGDDTPLFSQTFTTGTSWQRYSGDGIVALGHTVRFAFDSVSATGGNMGQGNYLDAADFGVGVGVVPEPSTWVIFLAGLAATACIARRSRSACGRQVERRRLLSRPCP